MNNKTNTNDEPSLQNPPIYIDPLSDFGFKKIFFEKGQEELLRHFLNAIFLEANEEQIKTLTYLPSEHLGFDKDTKRVVQDLECITDSGSTIIVEMQRAKESDFKDRLGFYSMRACIDTLEKGERYKLNKVISIACLNFDFRIESSNFLHIAQNLYIDNSTPFILTPKYILIEFPKFKLSIKDVNSPLHEWIWNLVHLVQDFKPNEKLIQKESFASLFSRAKYVNLSSREQKAYIKNIERGRKMKYALEASHQDGINEGFIKGTESGIHQTALNMISKGYELQVIADATNLSIEQIQSLRKSR